jgi:hypothetical protein
MFSSLIANLKSNIFLYKSSLNTSPLSALNDLLVISNQMSLVILSAFIDDETAKLRYAFFGINFAPAIGRNN